MMHACRYEPLFNMFGVDLLLFGHVHAYERTNPVSNYQADASGCSPVYITIGIGRIPSVTLCCWANGRRPWSRFVD